MVSMGKKGMENGMEKGIEKGMEKGMENGMGWRRAEQKHTNNN